MVVPDRVVIVPEDGNGKLVPVKLVTLRFVMVALVAVNWVIEPLEPRIVEDAVVPIVVKLAVVPVAVVRDAEA